MVESRQFRDLLLLFRPELTDEDLPHRTMISEGIIKIWDQSFLDIKHQLAVGLMLNILQVTNALVL